MNTSLEFLLISIQLELELAATEEFLIEKEIL